jgi:hypothetical protein
MCGLFYILTLKIQRRKNKRGRSHQEGMDFAAKTQATSESEIIGLSWSDILGILGVLTKREFSRVK